MMRNVLILIAAIAAVVSHDGTCLLQFKTAVKPHVNQVVDQPKKLVESAAKQASAGQFQAFLEVPIAYKNPSANIVMAPTA
mmetsp:Transcript_13603/g.30187  ORF Transcript_13603/g.30187 Transcript_13603/m.30187 type:complete len:81 (+) Transcript_13603:64-306(+)|eukprot:CAMPEP_0204270830 /NCGR_PEP_ID=MMETSP0468-20130131/19117_1 /ASSEMBLY_ACC=CAM_ASM_000383 /TAXON_ID=2969 /ORGANISM="Oxyrrhis marina" /LENGTH=80 /DNA_ID=CAMNT_0051246409 /DNA_START=58 /DNA_END=300 /DNA_ORIENTATION=-